MKKKLESYLQKLRDVQFNLYQLKDELEKKSEKNAELCANAGLDIDPAIWNLEQLIENL